MTPLINQFFVASIVSQIRLLVHHFRKPATQRYKVHVNAGVTYSSRGASLVDIDAQSGATVIAYDNARVKAACGSIIYKHKGAEVDAEKGAIVVECSKVTQMATKPFGPLL